MSVGSRKLVYKDHFGNFKGKEPVCNPMSMSNNEWLHLCVPFPFTTGQIFQLKGKGLEI